MTKGINQNYDAIVIGAGLGGLSAATMLAHEGISVLLLERHNIPGGYATSFVRGRYEFEVALHELSGIGTPEKPGGLYRYLDYLGVASKVEFLKTRNLYRSIFPEIDIILPAGRDAFESKICDVFPHEADGIRRFLKRIFDLRSDFVKLARQRGSRNPLSIPFRTPHFFRYLPVTWGKVLDRDVSDPLARAVLSQYWGYAGMPPSKISFLFMATTLGAYIKQGAAFPKGRSQALSNAFLERFEELGGEARMSCGVQRIGTSNGRVNSVITDDGEEIQADWIISNADPITTCRDMIGLESVPNSFFKKLQSSEVAASTVNVYLGIARSHTDLGFNEHEIFINADCDLDSHYQAMRTLKPPPAIAVTCYNKVYPEISPPGTCVAVLTALSFGEPWKNVQPDAYVETKNRIADSMIKMAEQVTPGLRQYTEVVEVSTPITNMRYANTLEGSIYGFNQPPHDNLVWRMGQRGPLDGLYFVGAWTQPGGGFQPAIMSGGMVARSINYKIKKLREGNGHV